MVYLLSLSSASGFSRGSAAEAGRRIGRLPGLQRQSSRMQNDTDLQMFFTKVQ